MLMVLCLALTGCARDEKTTKDDKKDLSILLLINGTLGDKSFFDSAEAGMDLIKEKYPEITTKTIEMGTDETKYNAILEENVSSKAYDIIIAGTWQLKDRFQECPLFEGIPSGTYFYFTHGYIAPSGPFVVGETTHSVTFPSAVQYGEAAYGVQFHPEKSSDAGARLLQNFVSIVKGA